LRESQILCQNLDGFTAMNIRVVIFWVMTSCSDMVGY